MGKGRVFEGHIVEFETKFVAKVKVRICTAVGVRVEVEEERRRM